MPVKGISQSLQALLTSLHQQSLTQETAIPASQMQEIRAKFVTDLELGKQEMDALMLDKFIALDEDKSHFVYNLLLANSAKTVVEIGTSFGVSTIYLALAVNANAGDQGLVIATEKESSKAKVAADIWRQAGPEIEGRIKLLEGDLEKTLASQEYLSAIGDRSVDAVLLDIWPYIALPALRLLLPKLRPGAIIVTDNTIMSERGYQDLFTVVRDVAGPFSSITLPYKGGLEMSVYRP